MTAFVHSPNATLAKGCRRRLDQANESTNFSYLFLLSLVFNHDYGLYLLKADYYLYLSFTAGAAKEKIFFT